MRVVRNILLMFGMVVGLTLSASAQKSDDKKPPPKNPNPPVINPAPPKNPPDNGKGKKKPGGYDAVILKTRELSDPA